MKQIQLGHSTIKISRQGFGCMGMSEFYGGQRDDEASIRTLHAAIERGVNFFDTADMYGIGHNEELVRRAFSDRWDKVTVATKFAIMRDADGGRVGVCARPDYIRQACEASLKRLGVDHISLYYQHRPDPNVPLEDSMGALKDLVQEGKIGHIGLSEFSAADLRRAHAIHPISALQSEYSMWSRDIEPEILPTCRELGITLVAYSPLGRGFLTGAIPTKDSLDAHDWRRQNPRFTDEAIAQNQAFLDLIQELAKAHDATPAQIALAWVMAQGEDVVPIAGTRKISRLEENLGANAITFSPEQLQEIRDRLPAQTAGARY